LLPKLRQRLEMCVMVLGTSRGGYEHTPSPTSTATAAAAAGAPVAANLL